MSDYLIVAGNKYRVISNSRDCAAQYDDIVFHDALALVEDKTEFNSEKHPIPRLYGRIYGAPLLNSVEIPSSQCINMMKHLIITLVQSHSRNIQIMYSPS